MARLARLGIPGQWPKLPPGMSTGTRSRRWYGGAARAVARTPHPPLIQVGDWIPARGAAGVTCTLGLRRAVDAGHISAIDNCTRKALGERPS